MKKNKYEENGKEEVEAGQDREQQRKFIFNHSYVFSAK